MRRMTDVDLIYAYKTAIEHDLDTEFIKMLEEEIRRREMTIPTVIKEQEK